jgi:pimeloyl-ACP methyl ester carboxylesterase
MRGPPPYFLSDNQLKYKQLPTGGEANRDNNYILDHVDSLKEIPVHIVHGRYDRVCHLYQAEALVRALRAVGNNEVNYFITTAGHSSWSRKPTPSYAGS